MVHDANRLTAALAERYLGVAFIDPGTRATTRLVRPDPEGWSSAETVAWSPDGRTAYYMARDALGRMSLWNVPADGGPPTMLVLFDNPTRTPTRPNFAVDHRRLYFTLPDHQSDVWVLDLSRPN